MLRVSGLKLSLDDELERLPHLAAKKLGIRLAQIQKWHIFKQSVDARKNTVSFVYTVDVALKDEAYILSKHNDPGISRIEPCNYEFPAAGTEKLSERPVVIGAGPAGLFAGLLLARMGYCPLVIERGDDVDTRSKKVQQFWSTGELNPESNIQFGEGGAGTFSDGKLTTLIKDMRCRKVLEELVEAGAPPEILYAHKPHIGTDILRRVVKNLRLQILELGGEFLFASCVTGIRIENSRIMGVTVNGKDNLPCQAVVLATGHSARDTYELLNYHGVNLIAKPFSVGVRIEHHQKMIDKAQYKEFAGHPKLGAADYKLAYHSPAGRSAYTFCMCPGGVVVAAASEQGGVVTNGMSEHARAGENANSALLVGITPEDFPGCHPLAGIEFQRTWEKKAFTLGRKDYQAPAQLVADFLAHKPSLGSGTVKPTYARGVVFTDLAECLPSYVIHTLSEAILDFERKLTGFACGDAVLTGVETRSSSPVRIVRQNNFESSLSGLFPAGEGAGYAGGIVSAAVDGIKTAEALVKRFKPLRLSQ